MSRIFSFLARDRRGISTVEFAILAPVMMVMLMGFFDLAQQAYIRSVLQGAMQQAGRNSTLESGGTSATSIDTYVTNQVKKVTGPSVTFTPTRLSYSDFNSVGKPETFVDKPPLNNKYDPGECYYDINGNGHWDADLGKTGQGGADDAVLYTMTVSYKHLFPMAKLLGWTANQTVTASTVLRNQPFGDQVVPAVSCLP